MNEKMFRDYIVLESRVKESNLTIDEMSYNISVTSWRSLMKRIRILQT